jgi:drug/metabolite transporter (DMT)-like permease
VGPMATMAMGVLVLGEAFTAWLVAGTVLVIFGVLVCSRAGR